VAATYRKSDYRSVESATPAHDSGTLDLLERIAVHTHHAAILSNTKQHYQQTLRTLPYIRALSSRYPGSA